MRKIILAILVTATVVSVEAQTKKKETSYYIIPQIALLNGDHAVDGQVQLTGGIEKKKWGFGLGVAVDYYKIRTMPVFADVRLFLDQRNQLFSYVDLGCNIAAPLASQQKGASGGWFGRGDGSFSNGLYTDLGIGYAIHGRKKGGVLMSFGYSLKTISERYIDWGTINFFPATAIRLDNNRKADYVLSCFSIKLGVRL